MGYDFGYKMEGCFAGTAIRFDTLERTRGTSCTNPSSSVPAGLSFDLECTDSDDDQYRTASITSNSMDVVVMMKGGPGGVIYSGLEAGSTYSLDVGQRKGISHMEFCFSCSEEQQDQNVPVLTASPTASPTMKKNASPTTPSPTTNPPTTPSPTTNPPTTAAPSTSSPVSIVVSTMPPTKCFHCSIDMPPPLQNQQQEEEQQAEETTPDDDIVLISSTVQPIATAPPTVQDNTKEENIILISAPINYKSASTTPVVLHGRWYVVLSLGSFLLLMA